MRLSGTRPAAKTFLAAAGPKFITPSGAPALSLPRDDGAKLAGWHVREPPAGGFDGRLGGVSLNGVMESDDDSEECCARGLSLSGVPTVDVHATGEAKTGAVGLLHVAPGAALKVLSLLMASPDSDGKRLTSR